MLNTVGNHMIKSPFVVEPDLSIQEALETMLDNQIRHLPITEDGQLVGLVSERNLREVMTLPIANDLKVKDVMKSDVFVAKRSSALRDVIATMEHEKIGSVVIVNDQLECVGIFTLIDALRVLLNFLEQDDFEASLSLLEDYDDFWSQKEAI